MWRAARSTAATGAIGAAGQRRSAAALAHVRRRWLSGVSALRAASAAAGASHPASSAAAAAVVGGGDGLRRPGVSLTAAQIRASWASFFGGEHGHTVVPSASLLPHNDKTLLFTNAGMVPFKDVFMGLESRPYTRAASVQRCVRAGGKHNDLDSVGVTARHHTLFEMLGNFGWEGAGYFKAQAIALAWQYLTRTLQLPQERLRVSVYKTDDESSAIWQRVTGWGSNAEATGRIIRLDKADNFWSMGDGPGPCGPCTEVFWDQGREVDGDRWLEIWNLVFMQFDNATGNKLAVPCVDTGMGLERIASVLQGVPTNYDIDSNAAIMRAIHALVRARLSGAAGATPAAQGVLRALSAYRDGLDRSPVAVATRVVLDHARACTTLLADGVTPSNVGAGYVLRRIIRRAVRYGTTLQLNEPFLYALVPAVIESFAGAYPHLAERAQVIQSVLQNEEKIFHDTLHSGERVLQSAFGKLERAGKNVVPGDTAFLLYDSYSFPVDLTALIARERGFEVDTAGFDAAMAAQRDRARAARKEQAVTFSGDTDVLKAWQTQGIATEFTGYDSLTTENARVLAVATDPAVAGGEAGWVALSPCPFYAVGGGQVGDTGALHFAPANGGAPITLHVTDTLRPYAGCAALRVAAPDGVKLADVLRAGTVVSRAAVDADARGASAAHHTATHLLNAGLSHVLGARGVSVAQAGSLVTPQRLRFDFTGPQPTAAEVRAVEEWVNAQALSAHGVHTQHMTLAQAKAAKAVAMFNEKYDEGAVRVVSVGAPVGPAAAAAASASPASSTAAVVSAELCGGTHVRTSRECFPFKILSEGSVSAGTRRIEAVAGAAAFAHVNAQSDALARVAAALRVPPAQAESGAAALVDRVKALETELDAARALAADASKRTYQSVLAADAAPAATAGAAAAAGGKKQQKKGGAAAAVASGPTRVFVHTFGTEATVQHLRDAAQRLLVASTGSTAGAAEVHVCVCAVSGRTVADANAAGDAKRVYALLTAKLPGSNGGGSRQRAQGLLAFGDALGNQSRVEAALARVLPPASA